MKTNPHHPQPSWYSTHLVHNPHAIKPSWSRTIMLIKLINSSPAPAHPFFLCCWWQCSSVAPHASRTPSSLTPWPKWHLPTWYVVCVLMCLHSYVCVCAHVLKQLSDERVLLMGAHASRLMYFIQLMAACLDDGASHGYLSWRRSIKLNQAYINWVDIMKLMHI